MKVKDILYTGIIVLILVMYFLKPTHRKGLEDMKKENQELMKQISNKGKSIDSLGVELEKSNKLKSELEKQYQQNKPKYVKIKQEHYIKDSIIGTYDVTQLEYFFTNRYSDSTKNR